MIINIRTEFWLLGLVKHLPQTSVFVGRNRIRLSGDIRNLTFVDRGRLPTGNKDVAHSSDHIALRFRPDIALPQPDAASSRPVTPDWTEGQSRGEDAGPSWQGGIAVMAWQQPDDHSREGVQEGGVR